jgi:hypothetical protein
MLNLRNHRQCPAGGFSFLNRRIAGGDHDEAGEAAIAAKTCGAMCKRRIVAPGAPNRSTVKLRSAPKSPANAGHFVAFFPCCGAGTRFVHLSFRVKSAFLEVTLLPETGPEIAESSCLILQS